MANSGKSPEGHYFRRGCVFLGCVFAFAGVAVPCLSMSEPKSLDHSIDVFYRFDSIECLDFANIGIFPRSVIATVVLFRSFAWLGSDCEPDFPPWLWYCMCVFAIVSLISVAPSAMFIGVGCKSTGFRGLAGSVVLPDLTYLTFAYLMVLKSFVASPMSDSYGRTFET